MKLTRPRRKNDIPQRAFSHTAADDTIAADEEKKGTEEEAWQPMTTSTPTMNLKMKASA